MADDGGTDDEDEWRFSVDDVGDDEAEESEDDDGSDPVDADGWTFGKGVDSSDDGPVTIGEDDDGPTVRVGGDAAGDADGEGAASDDGEGGNVAGALAPETPVEPGTPDPEGVVFVAAGALLTVLVFGGLVFPLTLQTIGYATLGVAVAAGLLYAFFLRF